MQKKRSRLAHTGSEEKRESSHLSNIFHHFRNLFQCHYFRNLFQCHYFRNLFHRGHFKNLFHCHHFRNMFHCRQKYWNLSIAAISEIVGWRLWQIWGVLLTERENWRKCQQLFGELPRWMLIWPTHPLCILSLVWKWSDTSEKATIGISSVSCFFL